MFSAGTPLLPKTWQIGSKFWVLLSRAGSMGDDLVVGSEGAQQHCKMFMIVKQNIYI